MLLHYDEYEFRLNNKIQVWGTVSEVLGALSKLVLEKLYKQYKAINDLPQFWRI